MKKWKEVQKLLIDVTLRRTGGNKTLTAEILGISVRSLRVKINEFGLQEWKGTIKKAKEGDQGYGRPTKHKEGKHLQ